MSGLKVFKISKVLLDDGKILQDYVIGHDTTNFRINLVTYHLRLDVSSCNETYSHFVNDLFNIFTFERTSNVFRSNSFIEQKDAFIVEVVGVNEYLSELEREFKSAKVFCDKSTNEKDRVFLLHDVYCKSFGSDFHLKRTTMLRDDSRNRRNYLIESLRYIDLSIDCVDKFINKTVDSVYIKVDGVSSLKGHNILIMDKKQYLKEMTDKYDTQKYLVTARLESCK